MALIKCPECENQISDQSKTCPHCGYRLNAMSNEEKSKIKKIAFAIVGVIVGIILIAVIYDACTVTTDELMEDLRKSKKELEDIQKEIDDLEEQKRWNDWLIDYYENKD